MRVFWNLLFSLFLVSVTGMAFADDDKGGKGGKEGEKTETAEEKLAAALKREEDLKTQLEAERKKKKKETEEDDDDEEDNDLRKKAKRQKDDADNAQLQTKNIERALSFNMSIDDFVAKNASLLPNEIASIVKLAHKETYDNATAKASALKAAMIQSYFGVQANMDALTASQRSTLDDYLKLTKTGKESKAADIYENIFEPALETIRKVKKAEEVGRGRHGFANPSDSSNAYKDKLVKMSRKTHLGEKDA